MKLQLRMLASFALVAIGAVLASPGAAVAATGWSTPVPLSSTIFAGVGTGMKLAVAQNGTVFAAWTAWNGVGYIAQVATSTDAGITWSAPTTLSNSSGHAESVDVAVNSDGDAMVVWNADETLWQVQYSASTDGGVTWSDYLAVSDVADSAIGAHVVGLGTGGFIVTMDAYNGIFSDVVVRTTPDAGTTWSAPQQLSNGVDNSIFNDVAVDENGSIAVTWLTNVSGEYQLDIASSQDGGSTWSSITSLAPGEEAADYPSLVPVSGGGFALVWRAIESGASDIRVNHSSDGGLTWSNASPIASSVGELPQIVVAPGVDGRVMVSWAQNDGATLTLMCAVSLDSGTSFGNATVVATYPIAGDYPIYRPAVAVSGAGELLAVWSHAVDNSGQNDYVSFASSVDNGATWSSPLVISDLGASVPRVVSTQDGDVIVGWSRLVGTADPSSRVETTTRFAIHTLPNTGVNGAETSVATGVTVLVLAAGVAFAVISRRRQRINLPNPPG